MSMSNSQGYAGLLASVGFAVLFCALHTTADTVFLKDGDEREGTVIERSEDQLILRLPTGEEEILTRSEVETFIIERTKVILNGGESITGRIVDDQEEKIVLEVERGTQIELAQKNIKKTEDVRKRYAGLPSGKELPLEGPLYWSGEFGVGYTVLRGNSEEDDFYARGRATYERKPVTNETTAQFNYATSEGQTTEDEAEIENQLNYSISKHMFLFHGLSGGYDNIQRIDYFAETSAGVGVELLVDSPSMLSFRGGPSYRFEKRDGADDRSEVSALLAQRFTTKLNDRIDFRQEYRFYPSLTNSGEYRQKLSAGLNIDLVGSWVLDLYAEQHYDSNPVPGTEKEDLKFVSTLGYSF